MALICANTHSVPVTFPVNDDGYAKVTAMNLCLRLEFQEESLYVDEKILDSEFGLISHTIGQLSFRNKVRKLWLLKPRKYRA